MEPSDLIQWTGPRLWYWSRWDASVWILASTWAVSRRDLMIRWVVVWKRSAHCSSPLTSCFIKLTSDWGSAVARNLFLKCWHNLSGKKRNPDMISAEELTSSCSILTLLALTCQSECLQTCGQDDKHSPLCRHGAWLELSANTLQQRRRIAEVKEAKHRRGSSEGLSLD